MTFFAVRQFHRVIDLGFQLIRIAVIRHLGVEVLEERLRFELRAADALFRVPAILGDQPTIAASGVRRGVFPFDFEDLPRGDIQQRPSKRPAEFLLISSLVKFTQSRASVLPPLRM